MFAIQPLRARQFHPPGGGIPQPARRQKIARLSVILAQPDGVPRRFFGLCELPGIDPGPRQESQPHVILHILRVQPVRMLHISDTARIARQIGFVARLVQRDRVIWIQFNRDSELCQRLLDPTKPLAGCA